MGEKETVRLIAAGASDMMGPALVVLLAGGVSVIMNNTQTLDTILNSMEQLVSGASAGFFAFLTVLVNIPLACPDPLQLGTRRAGHAAAGAAGRLRRGQPGHHHHRLGHGPRPGLMMAPTSVVLVGGLAIAKVGYNKYLRFVWPLLLALFIVSTLMIGAAATFE